jgi:hypothetical protein
MALMRNFSENGSKSSRAGTPKNSGVVALDADASSAGYTDAVVHSGHLVALKVLLPGKQPHEKRQPSEWHGRLRP